MSTKTLTRRYPTLTLKSNQRLEQMDREEHARMQRWIVGAALALISWHTPAKPLNPIGNLEDDQEPASAEVQPAPTEAEAERKAKLEQFKRVLYTVAATPAPDPVTPEEEPAPESVKKCPNWPEVFRKFNHLVGELRIKHSDDHMAIYRGFMKGFTAFRQLSNQGKELILRNPDDNNVLAIPLNEVPELTLTEVSSLKAIEGLGDPDSGKDRSSPDAGTPDGGAEKQADSTVSDLAAQGYTASNDSTVTGDWGITYTPWGPPLADSADVTSNPSTYTDSNPPEQTNNGNDGDPNGYNPAADLDTGVTQASAGNDGTKPTESSEDNHNAEGQ